MADIKNTKRKGMIKSNFAQTAIELAVFGAILIFVIGLIIRTVLGYGYQQSQNLKAMRQAMRTSYMYSRGMLGVHGDNNASRNSASVVVVEDRLSSSSAKYGTIDRVPYITAGNATHSRNLFLPLDDGEDHNLPVTDFYINGKHFAFQTAKFRDAGTGATYPYSPPIIFDAAHDPNPPWDPNCAILTLDTCGGGLPCTPANPVHDTAPLGCSIVYTSIPNHFGFADEWDNSCDICFDLDRSGTFASPDPDVPAGIRPFFAWQWKVRYAFEEGKSPKANLNGARIGMDESGYYDIDGDYKEEKVIRITSDANGVVTAMRVIDMQEGDYDTTWSESDGGFQPGLQRDVKVYTFLKGTESGEEGTYALVEEGKLYSSNPARQYIRTVKKKDQLDVIQREFQLSNSTGRFCNKNTLARVPTIEGEENPVEICVPNRTDCFGSKIDQTCMAVNDRYIFIRSRIIDRRGHKWVTDLSGDDTVEFKK